VKPPSTARTLWNSTVGKKAVMAVSGLIMLAFLVLHMLGNLKIFFGREDFDHYAHYLRTIGTPVLHQVWFLWIERAVLTVAFFAHVVSAVQLSRRDAAARPTRYVHAARVQGRFTTHTMRYGGAFLLLFIVWHLLDLTTGTVSAKFVEGHPYANVVADFDVWWRNLIYIVAMLLLGLHINHGFWSASQTLGGQAAANRRSRTKIIGTVVAVLVTAGFIAVPVGVMTGLVS
jgi:succinate dehydrogenase / fumarate reductase cytochrome b subunit